MLVNENLNNILKGKSKEDIYKKIWEFLNESPEKILNLLNKYNKGLFLIHIGESSYDEIHLLKKPDDVLTFIADEIIEFSNDQHEFNNNLTVCTINQSDSKGRYYDEGSHRMAEGMIQIIFSYDIIMDFEGKFKIISDYYVN